MHVLEHQRVNARIAKNLRIRERLLFNLRKSYSRRRSTRQRADMNHRDNDLRVGQIVSML